MLSYAIPAGNDLRVLDTLSWMPFAEHRELAAFAALSSSSTLDSLRRLHAGNLVDFVRHTRSGTSRVRRWYIPHRGIARMAELLGTIVSRLLDERPLSDVWQTALWRRLDDVGLLYRVAHEATYHHGPVGWCWQLGELLDALLELSDGRTLGLTRLGNTLPWKTVRRRMGGLYGMQRERRCPTVLLIVPGCLDIQRLRADLRGRAIDACAAVEDEVASAEVGSAVWRSLDSPQGMTLDQVAVGSSGHFEMSGTTSLERVPMPSVALSHIADGLDLLATELSEPSRRLLEALYDWPVMTMGHLGALLGMREAMFKKTRADLVKRGLVCQLRIGETAEMRQLNGTRLCLSPDGVRYIARRDGFDEERLLERWRVVPDASGDERLDVRGHILHGSRLRVLVRELSHTDGVSDILAALAVASRGDYDWRLCQALPPHRWERWFTYNGARRCIRPDCILQLSHRGMRRAYLLEYEQSAIRPAAMRAKLEKYEAYFNSVDSRLDFDGRRARTLFVFADETTAARFGAVAAQSAQRPIPLLVSSLEMLTATGPLERVWRSPWDPRGEYVSLAAVH